MKYYNKKLCQLLLILGVSLLLVQNVFAQQAGEGIKNTIDELHSKTIPVGKIRKNTQGFTLGDTILPSYSCAGISYVVISDLRQIGGNITWDPITKKAIIHDFNQPVKENPNFIELEDDQVAYLGRDSVYINHQEIPAIFIEGKSLIPTKWLSVLSPTSGNDLFKIVKEDHKWYESNDTAPPNIKGIHIWFDGENYVENQDPQYDLMSDFVYVGFVISQIDDLVNADLNFHKSWLKNPTYHTIPNYTTSNIVDLVFPPTLIKGIMKYTVGAFKKDEIVSIYRATSGSVYFVEGKDGKLVRVPWNSVDIQKSPISKKEATNKQIEAYINQQNLSSRTPYLVWTDIYRQRTYIFKGKKNNWTLIKNFLSSSGKDITPTPRGTFTLGAKVTSFRYERNYLVKNAYGFINTKYLYHSMLYDLSGKHLLEGTGILGTKASKGCIRLSPEDNQWFYNTMPAGTTVYIN